MQIFKLIDAASKAIFSAGKTATKEASKHNWGTPKWQYEYISKDSYPYLHSSDYLKQMMNDAIRRSDSESAKNIIRHINKHRAGDIDSYGKIINVIKKTFEEINFIDFLL